MSPRTLDEGAKRSGRGRPRGRSAKQREAQAMIAAGVQPLEAFTRAGFAYPAREVKRQAATVAEASGCDPLETCRHVARYGQPTDQVTACGVLFRCPSASQQRSTCVAILIPYRADLADDHEAYARYAEAYEARERARIRRERTQAHADDDRTFARGILNSLLTDPKVTDAVAVRAARELLDQHPAQEQQRLSTDDDNEFVFLSNGRELPDDDDGVRYVLRDNGRAATPPVSWPT